MENVTTPRPAAGFGLTAITLAASLLAGAGHALAQDAPDRFDWSGAYAGVHLGGAKGEAGASTRFEEGKGANTFSESGFQFVTEFATVDPSSSGFSGGGLQAGYNWQSGRWVMGLEVDLARFRTTTDATTAPSPLPGLPNDASRFTVSHSVETDWLVTLRPRIGYTTGNFLIFGTAGLAVSKLNTAFTYSDNIADVNTFIEGNGGASGTTSKTVAGWTIGGGVEAALSPNWIVKADYLYANFDGGAPSLTTDNLRFNGANSTSQFTQDTDLHFHIGRIGLNYKF